MAASALTFAPTAPSTRMPWIMLFGRTIVYIAVQALIALVIALSGTPDPWGESAGWWLFSAIATNAVCLAVLVPLFRAEGESYWANFKIQRKTIGIDLLALLGFSLISGPAGFFPNLWLAKLLFGGSEPVLDLFVRPLPFAAAGLGMLIFPISQGLVEIPLYFIYVMPRLKAQGVQTWLAVGLPVLMLGLQHLAIPLRFDLRFIAWRGLMFLPFALTVGLIMHRRPRLLPYIVTIHALINFSLAPMFLAAAY